MKANELRIGNLILYSGKIEPVIKIESDTLVMVNDLYLDEELEYIPLTEEWLLKFGFEKDWSESGQITAWYKIGKWRVYFDNGKYFFCNGLDFLTKIQFVHQLQNLYFALTGEGLTIKQTATA